MIRVLVVDDSPVVRRMLQRAIDGHPAMQVVGTAGDPYEARDQVVALNPDVMTLDLHMPRMDGIAFLRKLMAQFPVRTVVVSGRVSPGSPEAVAARAAGAAGCLAKPAGGSPAEMLRILCGMIVEVAKKPIGSVRTVPAAPRTGLARPDGLVQRPEALVVGASTGGPPAVIELLRSLPADAPPVVLSQHISPTFVGPFAARIARSTALGAKVAETGDRLRSGLVLVAPADHHLRLRKRGAAVAALLDGGPTVCGHRPSVDVMMQSAATVLGPAAVGIVLTGMGNDGAAGLLAMRRAGATTFAQDEDSCVVYGMPRAAAEAGAASFVGRVGEMAERLAAMLGSPAVVS